MKPRASVPFAFAVIYIVWGTTYLAVRFVLGDGVPPMALVALRYVVAALPLLAWALSRGWVRPTRAQLGWAAVVGTLLCVVGNGSVVVAERRMPSGVAALMVGLVPMWLVLFHALAQRKAPSVRVLAALAAAIAGVAVLSTEGGGWTGGVDAWSVVVIACGSPGWAIGSLVSRRKGTGLPIAQAAGLQMLFGAAAAALSMVALGETRTWHPSQTAPATWLWLLYLAILGSVCALTCYLWLLRRVNPAAAGTYAFVNPVVAVVVGWLAGDGVLSWRIGLAGLLIVAAVVVVLLEEAALVRAARPVPAAAAEA